MCIHGGGNRSVDVDFHPAFLAFLGCDDDDAVGRTATVDGGGSRILQHLHAFYVAAVQFVHTGFGRHAVNDIKRIVVVQRSDTTDTDSGRTGRRAVCRDVHTWNTALQCLHGVVLVLLGQFVDADHRHGACQVGLALGSVTGHDHLVQLAGIRLQLYLQSLSGLQFHILISYIRYNDCGTLRCLERKITVNVGDGSIGSTFLYDRCTDDRFSLFVHHLSADICVLRHCPGTTQQKQQTRDYSR